MKRTVALLNVLLVVLLICTFLQQADAVSSAGKATVKWGEVKAKALEKGAKPSDSGELVMSEDEFAMAIWKYLSENQRDGAKLAPINIGQYSFEIMRDFPGHPLRPCVYQQVPHINIHVYKNGVEVYNIHLGAYRDQNTGRFTLVFFGQNTSNKTNSCQRVSFPSLNDLKNGFNNVKNFVEEGLKNMNASLGYVMPGLAITAAAYVIAVVVFSVLVPVLV